MDDFEYEYEISKLKSDSGYYDLSSEAKNAIDRAQYMNDPSQLDSISSTDLYKLSGIGQGVINRFKSL